MIFSYFLSSITNIPCGQYNRTVDKPCFPLNSQPNSRCNWSKLLVTLLTHFTLNWYVFSLIRLILWAPSAFWFLCSPFITRNCNCTLKSFWIWNVSGMMNFMLIYGYIPHLFVPRLSNNTCSLEDSRPEHRWLWWWWYILLRVNLDHNELWPHETIIFNWWLGSSFSF